MFEEITLFLLAFVEGVCLSKLLERVWPSKIALRLVDLYINVVITAYIIAGCEVLMLTECNVTSPTALILGVSVFKEMYSCYKKLGSSLSPEILGLYVVAFLAYSMPGVWTTYLIYNSTLNIRVLLRA